MHKVKCRRNRMRAEAFQDNDLRHWKFHVKMKSFNEATLYCYFTVRNLRTSIKTSSFCLVFTPNTAFINSGITFSSSWMYPKDILYMKGKIWDESDHYTLNFINNKFNIQDFNSSWKFKENMIFYSFEIYCHMQIFMHHKTLCNCCCIN